MITLLSGENSFEIDRQLRQIVAEFGGAAEKFDGVELEVRQLPDLLMGMSLFAAQRLVIIRELSANKGVWEVLPEWLERQSEDTHVVLIEPKPDKRTKTYKTLQAVAAVVQCKEWGNRDESKAVAWVVAEMKRQGAAIDTTAARELVRRVGLQQQAVATAVEQLAPLGAVTLEHVEAQYLPPSDESVFQLFELALAGDIEHLRAALGQLARTEDPYMALGLLVGQALQLAALVVGRDANVASDLGVSPYAITRLRPYAQQLTHAQARQIVERLQHADRRVKTSSVAPWVAIEHALLGLRT